jgi:Domain of unknown function (DUF4258)
MTDLSVAVFTDHARRQMQRRGLAESDVHRVLQAPDSIEPVRAGRIVAQKLLPLGEPTRDYLVRVFVDVDRTPAEIVTAYRTSRIGKYRRP